MTKKFFPAIFVMIAVIGCIVITSCPDNGIFTTTTVAGTTTTIPVTTTTVAGTTTTVTGTTTTVPATTTTVPATTTTVPATTTTVPATTTTVATTTTSLATTTTSTTIADWTILVHMDGDNNLEAAAITDINEMESVNLSGSKINVIVLLDRITGYDSSNGDWTNTRLYKVNYDSNGVDTTIVSQRLASTELGLTTTGTEELNMGNPATVSNFINFGKANYPANKYALIFWDHGSGWRSSNTGGKKFDGNLLNPKNLSNADYVKPLNNTTGTYKMVCVDDTSSSDGIYTQEIGTAVSGKGLTIIGFDACLEGMMEVAYEIRSSASYMIGSEDNEPGDGWEYNVWLNTFKSSSKTEMNFINAVVDSYQSAYSSTANTTLSAVDLTKVGSLMTALNTFSTKLYNECTTDAIQNTLLDAIYNYAEDYYSVPGDLNIDIYDMASEIFTRTNYADTEATALMTAVTNAVVDEWHHATGNPQSHGIALHFIPLDSSGSPTSHLTAYCKDYPSLSYPLSFVQNSTWVIYYPFGSGGLFWRLWYETLP